MSGADLEPLREQAQHRALRYVIQWPDALLPAGSLSSRLASCFYAPVPKVGAVEDFDGDLVLGELVSLPPYDACDRSIARVEPHKPKGFTLCARMRAAKHRTMLAQILRDGILDPCVAVRTVDQAYGN